jgi:hypothetical protein
MLASSPEVVVMRVLLLSVSCTMLMPHGLGAQDQSDAHIRAAAARQEAVRALDIRFRRTETNAVGAISERSRGLAKFTRDVPAKETTFQSVNRLAIDGDKIRFEDNHPCWRVPEGILRTRRAQLDVFDGSVAKTFYPGDETKENGLPSGTYENRHANIHVMYSVLMPITLTFRGLDPHMTPYPLTDAKRSGLTLPIDGEACDEYILEFSPESKVSFWLDPKKDYVARRISTKSGVQFAAQHDIKYRNDAQIGWMPQSWVSNDFSSIGRLLTSTKVEVLEAEYNGVLPATDFDIVFPPGTRVVDLNTTKVYRVQSNGAMRETDELGQELSAVISQPGDSWARRNQWFLVALGATFIAIVGSHILRRLRRAG